MLNALRLTEGFQTSLFADHTGQPISVVADALRRAEELELLQWDAQSIRPTERGRRYLNNLVELFLPPDRGKAKTSDTQTLRLHSG
jgi:oxygen-independent coproporphyrinogen-3 oxidase